MQGFGFRTSDNKRDPLMNRGTIVNTFVYCRTPEYHTFLFANRDEDNRMQAVKMLEDFAPLNDLKKALPDAITSCMRTFIGGAVKEAKKEDETNA